MKKTYFWLDLYVEATDGPTLVGPVIFHLHDTFARSVQWIRRVHDGSWAAYKDINCDGVFTVGAQVKDKMGDWISLEYDLNTIKELPKRFR